MIRNKIGKTWVNGSAKSRLDWWGINQNLFSELYCDNPLFLVERVNGHAPWSFFFFSKWRHIEGQSVFSYFLTIDLSLLSYFSFDGFVDSVPLDDFVQIGHEHHNLIPNSSYFLNLFNVDIIKCSDLFLKKWDN